MSHSWPVPVLAGWQQTVGPPITGVKQPVEIALVPVQPRPAGADKRRTLMPARRCPTARKWRRKELAVEVTYKSSQLRSNLRTGSRYGYLRTSRRAPSGTATKSKTSAPELGIEPAPGAIMLMQFVLVSQS